ncbi:MAG TPA: DUF3616 domain-containing protein [Polyangiales bacterium]|nr:DUF3616 domain-containing protein [Polyangiales bacterium]
MDDFAGSLLGRVALRFDAGHEHVPQDLSASLRTPGGGLLVAADELASLELLQPASTNLYARHRSFSLHQALELAPDDEIDIEGLARAQDADAFFLIGSHSAKRKKPRGKSDQADLERLADVKVEATREVLARIELHDGVPQLDRKLAVLAAEGEGSLLGLLARDPHLGPFVQRSEELVIPGKDNGFDVEGLAHLEGRLLVGLRGPVLRGWAFVLDLPLEVVGGALKLGGKKHRYRKHALDLDGLGVRDLLVHGNDVLVLAGPTMALDGAHRIFRWSGGPSDQGDTMVRQAKGALEHVLDVPFQRGFDRAEGIAAASWFDEDDSLLVIYDAPGKARQLDACTVLADVFAL